MSKTNASDCRILCCIPTRNCESTIGKTLGCFKGEILDHIEEILVIDNQSQDSTVHVTQKILSLISVKKTTIFQNLHNYGLGGSHKIAFKYAFDHGYDYLLIVHGDGSCDVRDLLPELKLGSHTRWDLLLSNRLAQGASRKNFGFHRLLGNKLVSLLASLATGFWIPDFSSGPINLYRVSSFLTKFSNTIKSFDNTIYFNQYLLLSALYSRRDVRYFNIGLDEPERKKIVKLFGQFFKLCWLIFRYFFFAKYVFKRDSTGVFFGKSYKIISVKKPLADQPPVAIPVSPVVEQNRNDFYDLLFPLSGDGFSSARAIEQLKSIIEKVGADRIFVSLRATQIEDVLQNIDLHDFCRRFGIAVGVVIDAQGELAIWQKVQDAITDITIIFHPKKHAREDLILILTNLSKQKDVVVQLETEKELFYHTYGLKLFVEQKFPKYKVQLHPYLLAEGARLDDDHIELLLDQDVSRLRYKTSVFQRSTEVSQVTQTRAKQTGYLEAQKWGFNLNFALGGAKTIRIESDRTGYFHLQH